MTAAPARPPQDGSRQHNDGHHPQACPLVVLFAPIPRRLRLPRCNGSVCLVRAWFGARFARGAWGVSLVAVDPLGKPLQWGFAPDFLGGQCSTPYLAYLACIQQRLHLPWYVDRYVPASTCALDASTRTPPQKQSRQPSCSHPSSKRPSAPLSLLTTEVWPARPLASTNDLFRLRLRACPSPSFPWPGLAWPTKRCPRAPSPCQPVSPPRRSVPPRPLFELRPLGMELAVPGWPEWGYPPCPIQPRYHVPC